MISPKLSEIKKLNLEDYDLVPIKKEMLSDFTTPIEVMRILKTVSKNTFLLESNMDAQNWGRYSFLGFNPKMEISALDKVVKCNGIAQDGYDVERFIREILHQNRSYKFKDFPTFTGGLVGYFAYDYFGYCEPNLELAKEGAQGFNDVDLMLFDEVIVFDNFKKKIVLIGNVKVNNLEHSYHEIVHKLNEIEELIRSNKKSDIPKLQLKSAFRPLFKQQEYCEMVKKAKHYIVEGDIFQVVLANRLKAQANGSLFDTYRVLRTTNPSPYMFYFGSDQLELAGASPETLVKLENGQISTFPLAGTRPRGKTDYEDSQYEESLKNDEKELAEHNMLVDLGRNDLGKIAKFNTVRLSRYLEVLKYSHVMHLGSIVTATIDEKYDALDAIRAVLPAGTLSGAPKIRAAEIINELENNRRGVYGGAVGYLDFTGNMDTCISIRLAYKQKQDLYVCSGAGIVYDSVPEKEHQECINKAKAIIQAIEMAQGGLE